MSDCSNLCMHAICSPYHLPINSDLIPSHDHREDLNVLVRRHIESVIQRSPSRALATLENDVAELIQAGMVTLNTKLGPGLDDEKLIGRVVEMWGFFWDQVLPYVEGVSLLKTFRLLYDSHPWDTGILTASD